MKPKALYKVGCIPDEKLPSNLGGAGTLGVARQDWTQFTVNARCILCRSGVVGDQRFIAIISEAMAPILGYWNIRGVSDRFFC